jgi:predicted nucleic-acid-binding protein
MIALDTNIIVRLLTRDDRSQAKRAAELIENNRVYVSKTVLLETEWVLRYTYHYDSPAINGALRAFAGLSEVELEEPHAVSAALDWHAKGMDFADALHLSSVDPPTRFVTFDRKLARVAGTLPGTPAVELVRSR